MKYLPLIILMMLSLATHGQTILGQWETYDDQTNEKKAAIEIYETNQLYFARIVESYISEENATCESCKGKKKGAPIKGLIIIEDLKKKGDEFKGGTILDPENGKVYKCSLQLIDDNKLKVRGYLGISLLGRTQYWIRKE